MRRAIMEGSRRRSFLTRMFREAMIPYEHPMEEWTEDEKEFLPIFVDLIGHNKLVLDLAGGYGRVTLHLLENDNAVILADLSIHSLQAAKRTLAGMDTGYIHMDMLHLPFADQSFDGVWFTQGFEYVPPDERARLLQALKRILKHDGIVFVNAARVPDECSYFSYLKNYLFWRLIKRQPVVWGEYIYKLNLDEYKGWHYHSLVFTRRTEKNMAKTGFRILRFKKHRRNGYPLAYLLSGS
jgi:ubiquinone/menaquinone biosynthesis C-methylase UbiE